MTGLLLLLLLQDPAALARDLGHEHVEIRSRAHDRLISLGSTAVPALRDALNSEDAEVRWRARLILEIVDREERERRHDQEARAFLMQQTGVGGDEDLTFQGTARTFRDGVVVSVEALNRLERTTSGPGMGFLDFDVEIRDAGGREAVPERCRRCSPRLLLVRGASGPFQVRVRGSRTWFSPYDLVFEDPREGESRRVGDFKIEVRDGGLALSSSKPFPSKWMTSLGTSYRIEPEYLISSGFS